VLVANNEKPVRIEDYILMFHAGCGGVVTGELGKELLCAESGAEMRGFVSDSDKVTVSRVPGGLRLVPRRE
jgi:hypothetical protein